MLVTQSRCILAGDLAGAWGPQLTNLANIALVASAKNQGVAAKSLNAQDAERHPLAGGRRDLSKVKQQLMEPYQPRISRTLARQKMAYELHGEKKWESKGVQKNRGAGKYPNNKDKVLPRN